MNNKKADKGGAPSGKCQPLRNRSTNFEAPNPNEVRFLPNSSEHRQAPHFRSAAISSHFFIIPFWQKFPLQFPFCLNQFLKGAHNLMAASGLPMQ
ncbi:MAG TPA: hypothetical protein VI564_05515 [Candidatus Nanoarchaeia archaeon]|nr:hypothetical protein [Candidatus Nanoarchaeia archaeon]